MTPNTTHSGTGATPASGTRSVLRIAFLLLIAGLLLLGAGAAPVAADTLSVNSYSALLTAINGASGDRTIVVTGDITLATSSATFYITTGKNITLMPGSTPVLIKRTVAMTNTGSMFNLDGGRLTLAANGANTLTLDGGMLANNRANLVAIYNGGAFTLQAGKLTNNKVLGNPAGVNVYSGTFTMTGGEISGNIAEKAGGTGCGVVIKDAGTFTMTGGKISGNTADSDSGVHIYGTGTFTMMGGEISGNIARKQIGAGVGLSDGTLIMGGNAVIAANNALYVGTNTHITLSDPFTGSAPAIGLSPLIGTGYKLIWMTGTLKASDYLSKFNLLDPKYGLVPDSTNKYLLVVLKNQLTVINGTGTGKYTTGSLVSITANTKSGYTFTKWIIEGGSIASTTAATTTFTMPAYAVTVTAELVPNTYTVHYNGNGATGGTTADSGHTYDVAQNLTKNGFINTGYTFAGWNKTAGGTTVDYCDEERVQNLTATNDTVVNLYAVWTSSPLYTVTVTGGEGSDSYAAGDTVRIEAIVPSGQTFDHWTVTGVTLDAPTSAAATFVMPANDVTATAVFKNAPVPPSPSPSPVPPSPSPAPSGGSSDGNMEHAYRILFDTAGGSFISPATGLSAGDRVAQPAAPVKDGYTFGGWYTDDACTKEWSFADRIDGDMTLYAKWTPLRATPTATVTVTAPVTATVTATATAPVVTASQTQEPTIQPDTRTNNPQQPASLPGFISQHLTVLAAAALAALFLFWFFLVRRKTVTFLVSTPDGIKQYRIRVRKNHTIDPDKLPDELLRHTWYLDGRHTDRWNFDEDTVIENITLYPGEIR